jgi:hypothetical protein
LPTLIHKPYSRFPRPIPRARHVIKVDENDPGDMPALFANRQSQIGNSPRTQFKFKPFLFSASPRLRETPLRAGERRNTPTSCVHQTSTYHAKTVLFQTNPLSTWAGVCLCLSLLAKVEGDQGGSPKGVGLPYVAPWLRALCAFPVSEFRRFCFLFSALSRYTDTSASSRRWKSRMARPRTMSVLISANSVTACRTQTRLTLRPVTRSSMASNREKSGITQ